MKEGAKRMSGETRTFKLNLKGICVGELEPNVYVLELPIYDMPRAINPEFALAVMERFGPSMAGHVEDAVSLTIDQTLVAHILSERIKPDA